MVFAHRASKPEKDPVVKPLPPNNPPVAHEPFITNGWAQSLFIGDPVALDLRHRVHECDAQGRPVEESGAYDPEGEQLEYQVEVVGPLRGGGKAHYAVWNESGRRLDDTGWIRNGDPRGFAVAPAGPGKPNEVQALCRFIVGHTATETPYPFTPKSCAQIELPPYQADNTKLGEVVFTYRVRDSKGAVSTASAVWSCHDGCKK